MWTLALAVALADDPAPEVFVANQWGVPVHYDSAPIFVRTAEERTLPGAAPGPRRLRPAVITAFALGVVAALAVTYPAGAGLAVATRVY